MGGSRVLSALVNWSRRGTGKDGVGGSTTADVGKERGDKTCGEGGGGRGITAAWFSWLMCIQ